VHLQLHVRINIVSVCSLVQPPPTHNTAQPAFTSIATPAVMDDDTLTGTCFDEAESAVPDWLLYGGFLIMLLALFVSFWGLAVIVEEYFVPALNLLCDDLKLADDVAGATIMAIGNSSPELFSCIISLFITKTALGVGTAIGSAIFNHLCICAGSILYAEGGALYLNWKVLARESTFYISSLIVLVWSLKGPAFSKGFAEAFDAVGEDTGAGCLQVEWYQALVLFAGYCLYAIVVSFYGSIVGMLCPYAATEKQEDEESAMTTESNIEEQTMADMAELVDTLQPVVEVEVCMYVLYVVTCYYIFLYVTICYYNV
jgi:Ca2+/Na+ antiporter